ncbi:MAG: divalent-cation tolerance protein CutA [Burkholderiaceae bacterium]
MKSTQSACVVVTTIDSLEGAEQLARKVVSAGLGACVQICPVKSFYQWQGQIQSDDEYRLEIKSLNTAFEPLQALLRRSHPYDTPEIIALPIADASAEYLAWLVDCIETPDAGRTTQV